MNDLYNKEINIANRISKQIELGKNSMDALEPTISTDFMKQIFEAWVSETEDILKEVSGKNRLDREFLSKVEVNTNAISKIETRRILTKGIGIGVSFLKELPKDLDYKDTKLEQGISDSLDKNSALVVIRRVLQNFYKHIQTMYQEELHGSGTIQKEDLKKIKIGNEYDVQRILYSLLRPIFPLTRVEVSNDTGYNAVRYDIIIDEYDVIIEVKCTRRSMSQRKLTEELGSDAFHYQADYLFFFVYDKENIIKNRDVFIESYRRKKEDFGCEVETIVNQPIDM